MCPGLSWSQRQKIALLKCISLFKTSRKVTGETKEARQEDYRTCNNSPGSHLKPLHCGHAP